MEVKSSSFRHQSSVASGFQITFFIQLAKDSVNQVAMPEEDKKRLSELLKDTEDESSELQVTQVHRYSSRLIQNSSVYSPFQRISTDLDSSLVFSGGITFYMEWNLASVWMLIGNMKALLLCPSAH